MATHAAPIPRQAWSVLIVSTLAFTVCVMVWMMFGVIGIPPKETPGRSATEFGLRTATPVLAGSLNRVPVRPWADRRSGRNAMEAPIVLMDIAAPTRPLMQGAMRLPPCFAFGVFDRSVGQAGCVSASSSAAQG